jgi:adhesin transport system membrane fusion protein
MHHPRTYGEWFVRKGQLVQKGDTILRLSEVKPNTSTRNCLDRTQEQINAKELTSKSYEEKVHSAGCTDRCALASLRIKLEQAREQDPPSQAARAERQHPRGGGADRDQGGR